ncbi:IS3 family transposase [Pseudonocardia sp. ICBG601]|uniref:IS3 family transposase n=1 Tax=Pseudonocardia sp. ICBG601 TaxID=2846759 RepID=UPI001CF6974B|nr:IS3 family transposase [Pseudonocardia sp. ICBG601]
MARKSFTDEFRRQAVDLYESTPGATVRGIADDLGIARGTLRDWLTIHGTGNKTAADGSSCPSPVQPMRTTPGSGLGGEEPPRQKIARLEARVRELEISEKKLTAEREILQRAAKYFAGGDALVTRFQFVADHRHTFEVKRLCELVHVSRSSFYAWLAAAPVRARRAAGDAVLVARIQTIHDGDNTIGAPRATTELNDGVAAADRVNHKRVARVMRAAGIAGYRRRRRVHTTIVEQPRQTVPDLLRRDFTAPAPNQVYVGDITYLPLAGGTNLYLATVIDCCSRKLAGWALADHMRTDLVNDALHAAERARGSLRGAVFHSDHGAVYTSSAYAELCDRLGVTRSMGAVGSSADNALAESFNATVKREVLQDNTCWPDAATCRRQVFRWLTRYNTRRRHSYCQHLSPNTYEQALPATVTATAA